MNSILFAWLGKKDIECLTNKEIIYEEVKYDPPKKIIGDLEELEKEIQTGLGE